MVRLMSKVGNRFCMVCLCLSLSLAVNGRASDWGGWGEIGISSLFERSLRAGERNRLTVKKRS
jgi:hypothetical protein